MVEAEVCELVFEPIGGICNFGFGVVFVGVVTNLVLAELEASGGLAFLDAALGGGIKKKESDKSCATRLEYAADFFEVVESGLGLNMSENGCGKGEIKSVVVVGEFEFRGGKGACRVVEFIVDIDVSKMEIRMFGCNVFLTPLDAFLGDVETVVFTFFGEKISKRHRHPTNPAADIEDFVVRLDLADVLKMTEEFLANLFEITTTNKI